MNAAVALRAHLAIRSEVHDRRRHSPILRALAKMNFPLIITTNVDQLFEKALADEHKPTARFRVTVRTGSP